jgi:outer membrane lipoprotein SlyB
MNATMTLPSISPGGSSAEANYSGLSHTPESNTKPLWAAIGILGVCVLAMGASLVHIQRQPKEPDARALVPHMQQLVSSGLTDPSVSSTDKSASKPGAAQESTAPAAIKFVAKQPAPQAVAVKTPSAANNGSGVQNTPAAAPAQAGGAASSNAAQAPPVPVQAAPVCASCGTVSGVTAITREGQGSGVGAVAGGVVGAVLGNQVGQGNGRTAATILGAVGGGWAGNKIEKNVKKQTVYAVSVRMDDGSVRNFEQATAPAVGAKVTVSGNTLRSSDGGEYAPAAKAKRPQPQRTQPTLANNTYTGGN